MKSKQSKLFQRRQFMFAAAAVGLSGCISAHQFLNGIGIKDPTVSCKSVRLKSISFSGIELEFGFEIENPNSVNITILDLEYELKVNGKKVAEGKKTDPLVIPRNGKTTFNLPQKLPLSELLENILELTVPTSVDYEIALKVGLKTPLGRLPVVINHKDTASILDQK